MAESSLSDFAPIINQQILISEKLTTCLTKTEALITLGMNTSSKDLTENTLYGYFWVLSDFLKEALQHSEVISEFLTSVANKKRN